MTRFHDFVLPKPTMKWPQVGRPRYKACPGLGRSNIGDVWQGALHVMLGLRLNVKGTLIGSTLPELHIAGRSLKGSNTTINRLVTT